MKKKLISIALTMALTATMGISVLAAAGPGGAVETGGGDQTIQGEGFIGFGSIIPDDEKSKAPGVDKIDEGDPALTGTGVAGAEIVVTWPDGATSTATVGTDGKWSTDAPASLQEGDIITVYQVEPDKHKSDNVHVTVGSGEGGVVEPEIPVNPDDYLNVTIPAKFFWYVMPQDDGQGNTTFGKVTSPEHYIRNNGFTFSANGKEKTYEAPVDVTLKSFTQTEGETLTNLTLNLTGDLAKTTKDGENVGTKNIANGFANASPYSAQLAYTNPAKDNSEATVWKFGFEGSYTGGIPTVAKQPKYEMTLHFSTDVEIDFNDFKPGT